MKYSILLLVLCIASLNALKMPQHPVFAQLSQHPFGKVMVNLVQNQVKVADKFESVIELIKDILKQMENDEATHQDNCSTELKAHDDAIKNFNKIITEKQKEQQELETTIATNQAELDLIDIPKLEQELTSLEGKLTTAEQNLEATKNQKKQDLADLAEAIKLCGQALDLLTQLKAKSKPSSYAQVNTLIQKIDNLQIKKSTTANLLQSVKPLLLLVQQKSVVPQASIDKVSSFISQLKKTLEDESLAAEKLFDSQIDTLEKKIVQLKQEIVDKKAEITRNKNRKKELEGFIKKDKETLAKVKQTIKDNQDLLAAEEEARRILQAHCDLGDKNFSEEIPILKKLLKVFQEKVQGPLNEENTKGINEINNE